MSPKQHEMFRNMLLMSKNRQCHHTTTSKCDDTDKYLHQCHHIFIKCDDTDALLCDDTDGVFPHFLLPLCETMDFPVLFISGR
jgi:hypothetical protein